MKNCDSCMHHCKRDGILFCALNHYFPRKQIIAFQGCVDYKKESIDLFNWRKEEDGE